MIVKDKKRGRPKGKSNKLSARSILDMAKSLMQNEGKIPSIRKLASSLSVDAMAIYYYFSNKNTLLEAITVSLIEDIYEPKVNDDWKHELTELSTSYLTLLDNYPGLLETLLSMDASGPAQVFIDRFNDVIKPLNLDEDKRTNALNLLVDYLHGYALALNNKNAKVDLNVDMLIGPLNFYCIALENAK
ncbi:TetR/AcrR family transcriptional regulator [Vibrio sp. VB16]|uniref:TetR/AcrR family transcriptional regulator n=1 Tax=Vibrio sp. VB16 TaxID=2785746 RepID=UPI00189EE028|nr:TetR/AcrR family transcriptional regulator [Vibrio sp. VB16]UGA57268.1 TetR/AcrR family transcriptional regulator [Vibrio sp. VB16]